MNQKQTKRAVLIGNIMIALSKFEIEELEAIERYCSNYHQAYQKPGKNHIITEITIDPMKELTSK